MGGMNINIPNMGSKTLAAYQMAIAVTSNNIANVNTPGYSRQTVVMQSAAVGGGVEVASIDRAHDIFLQNQIQSESSTNGKENAVNTALQRIEPLFSESTVTGIGSSLQEYFNAWQDLSSNPQGASERQALLGKAQNLVNDFHRDASFLNDVALSADQSLSGLATEVNGKLKQISDLNKQIYYLGLSGGSANVLRDQRDLALQELAKKIGTSFKEETNGMITVTLGSSPGGETLVSEDKFIPLAVDATNPGHSVITVNNTDITQVIRDDAKSGEMGGTLLVRDQIVPGFLGKLDELAFNLADQVNTQHLQGYDINGNAGSEFFTAPTTLAGYSTSISLNVTSTNQIAAASTQNGSGDNKNALALSGLKDKNIIVSGAQTTLTNLYAAFVGNIGVTAQNAQTGATQSDTMLEQLSNLRESAAGVNLDEELANLMVLQKSYEASAKLITTSLEMLKTVLDMVQA